MKRFQVYESSYTFAVRMLAEMKVRRLIVREAHSDLIGFSFPALGNRLGVFPRLAAAFMVSRAFHSLQDFAGFVFWLV